MDSKHDIDENPSVSQENGTPYGFGNQDVNEQNDRLSGDSSQETPSHRNFEKPNYTPTGYGASHYGGGAPDHAGERYINDRAPRNYGAYDRYSAQNYGRPTQNYGAPVPPYGIPVQGYGIPQQSYGAPVPPYGIPTQGYGAPPQGYAQAPNGYGGSAPVYEPRTRIVYENASVAGERITNEAPKAAETEPFRPHEDGDKPKSYAFKVRNLTKDYGGNVVLNNISFDIPSGKIVGLLGPNGCGKTTLIKILAGLIHDYSGMIKVNGKPVGISSKASLAYLPDRTYFPDRFRTIDCINYFADFFKDFDKLKAIDFAGRFGLDLNQKVKTMSKGMQEKLQLLVVMSRAADIYLLDEPLGGVDPAARSVILDIIMNNYKENATVVLSTHLVNDLEHSFDHVLMLGHGQVLVNTGIDTLRATGKSVEEIFKEVIGDAWEVE